MTTVVKDRSQLLVPTSIQKRAGIKLGDKVEFRASGGVITIVPKLPSAADEYTPAQRRVIDARLAEARKGPSLGPFDTAEEMIAHMKSELRKRAAAKRTKHRTE
jgi:bifunctional DNA-binding transcriptional regulator/antitoxin component of YhaV-PrlF toxin-antitoxin module